MKYKAQVSGEYKTKSNDIDSYETEIVVTTGEIAQARSIIQNGIITDVLRKELKDYKTWLTCQVDSIEPTSGNAKTDTDAEYDELMIKAADLGCVPANITSYKKLETRKKRLNDVIERKIERIKAAEEAGD